jgi:hypothetical protein
MYHASAAALTRAFRAVMQLAQQRVQAAGAMAPPAATVISAVDVLRAEAQLAVNAIAVAPQASASSRDNIAIAIFPAASLLNHTCCPSVTLRSSARHFEGPYAAA